MPSMLARRAIALAVALGGLLTTAPAAVAAVAPAGYRPFAADSIWNLPLRDDAPLDDQSAAYSAWLTGQVNAYGAYIDTTICAMPIYWADATTPTVRVRLAANVYQDPAMLRAWSAVPIPSGATPANCTDKNFAVLQRQPDGTIDQWEFWAAAKQSDGSWVARWGGATQDVQADTGIASRHSWSDPTSPTALAGVSRNGWNVTASSISMMAGVITRRDVEQGRIDHALSVALRDGAANRWMWPAQRTDGSSAAADAIPQGARLRLDPSLDLSTIPMVPLVRMMAEAAQNYGIVVRDKTYNNAAFYTEEVRPGESNPFAPLLNGKYPDQALKAFPWSRLRVLKAVRCSGIATCTTPQTATIQLLPGAVARSGAALTLDTSNAVLDQPRTRVQWDLNGDGAYERDAGKAVKLTYTPAASGAQTVRVRITTRSGAVVTGERTLSVAAPSAAAAAAGGGEVGSLTAPTPTGGGSSQQSTPTPGGSSTHKKVRRKQGKRRVAKARAKARAAARRKGSAHARAARKHRRAVRRER